MESGLTLSEIFKVIFRRVWWVIGATLLSLAVALLVTELWYNKTSQYYTINYEIVYPDSDSGKYPDGSDLFAAESVSVKTLNDIKDGKYSSDNPDEFKGVDVEDMRENDGISISEKIIKAEDGNIMRTYTLTVKAKYFSGKSQARAFMRAVAEYPVNRVNSIMETKNYGVYLPVFEDAPSYDEAISALIKQKSYLEEEYAKLKGYGEVADAGIASLHNIFTETQQNEIKSHILAQRYVSDTDAFKAEADIRIAALNLKIEENEKILASLRDAKRGGSAALGVQESTAAYNKTLSVNSYAEQTETSAVVADPYDLEIARLTVENGEMQNTIDSITATLEAIDKYTTEGTPEYTAKQAFDARLNGFCTQLEEAATTLKTVSVKVYDDNSRVVFSSNKLDKQGGINWFASAFIGALLGFIISSIVISIIDVPKYKREKLAAGRSPDKGGEDESAQDGVAAQQSQTVAAEKQQ